MNIDIQSEIDTIVSKFNQLPYLFVGTGLSMRYSNAPSWDKLLQDIWLIINNDSINNYKKFVKRIAYEINIDNELDLDKKKYYLNPQLATKIQSQFNKKFYEDDDFERIVFDEEEVNKILDYDLDPFKFYVAKQTNNLRIESSKDDFKEISYIVENQNKIAGIITTNYDHLLEELFTDFSVTIGQDKLLTSNTNNIFEIFKIHGSANKPNSIVITQEDYEYFQNKLKYLSAKLLTLFVEHPIIFIGYGMGDVNIRSILKEISECLNKEQLEEIKNNFIFVTPAFENENKEEISFKEIDFNDKKIVMTKIVLKDFSMLFKSLSKIKSSMPVKIIRKMQDMLCNFIATTEANKNIMVSNINNPEIDGEEIGIYIGNIKKVAAMGFGSYEIDDIIHDILFDDKPYLMNKELINKTFKNIRSIAGSTFLPVYKYINGLDIEIEQLPDNWRIIKKLSDIKLTTNDKRYTREEIIYKSINEIEQAYPNHLIKQFSYVIFNLERLSVDELGGYLKRKFVQKDCMEKHKSTIKKLVAAYDYLKYSKK